MRVCSLLVALALSIVTAQSTAVAQNAQPQQLPIVVIDIGYILENHPTMKGEMESIQAKMKDADTKMAQRRDAIIKQMEMLRQQYEPGTPEYEAEEKKIAEQDTEFRLALIKEKKKFEEMQAQVVYQIYTDISSQLSVLSKSYGTNLVVRISRQKMDPKKPETVQLVMSQEVVYYNPSIDVTDWTLNQLNTLAQQRGATVR